jgi:hypothetical protein
VSSLYAIFKDYGKQETFTCDVCTRALKKVWTDEEAIAEMQKRFPNADNADTLVVCDDCYVKFHLPEPFNVDPDISQSERLIKV